MARRRHRGRTSSRRLWIVGFLAIATGVWTYGRFVSPVLEGTPERPATLAQGPKLTSSRPEISDGGAGRHVPEKGEDIPLASTKPVDPQHAQRAKSLITTGMKSLNNGDLITARAYLSEAVNLGLDHAQSIEVRAALARIGAETIFGNRIYKDDPFVKRYTIAPGDSLAKIAKRYSITADFLAAINNIVDKNRIRAGQALKVVQGPLHARIHKKTYRMDIYLQNTFVRHFAVGLGRDDSTPTGEWIVGTKLENPTYYPPRGGAIVTADDPENPLGERWIELKGIKGEAVGQQRYGIHGTNEPDSIGQSASMGCVRMHNADVEEVYTYLVPKKSHVLVTD